MVGIPPWHQKMAPEEIGLHRGLRSYGGKHKRGVASLHLRFEGDRNLLIVDGVKVFSLNIEAAFIADMLLQGSDRLQIETRVTGLSRGANKDEVRHDILRIEKLLSCLARGEDPCAFLQGRGGDELPFCGFEEILDPRYPFRADLAITYDCPNNCLHCYAGRDRDGPPLGVEEWKKVISKLRTICVPYVCFTGGEPTVYDGLEELVRHASEEGLITGVLTNGRNFSDPLYASRLVDAGLDYVQITIESINEEIHNRMVGAGAWRETVEGIKNCVSLGIYTVTNTTLSRLNIERGGETASFAAALGAKAVAANHIIKTGQARKNKVQSIPYETLYSVIESMKTATERGGAKFLWYSPTPYCMFNPFSLDLGVKRCSAASGSICIDPSGNVLPCQSFFLPAGDFLRDSWDEIRCGRIFSAVRSWRSGIYSCSACPDAELCRGGCPLEEEFDIALSNCCPERRRETS